MKFVTDASKGIMGKPDSAKLWEQIILNMPTDILSKPDTNILNVACGYCTEATIMAKHMMSIGVNKESTKKSLWLLDKYRSFTNAAKTVFGFENVISSDFLNWKTSVKFNGIYGNPPYNKGLLKDIDNEFTKNAGGYPHLAFANKSLDLCEVGGFVSLIMPASFMTLTSCDKFRKDILANHSVKSISLYDNRKNQVFDIEHTWVCNIVIIKGGTQTKTEYMIFEDTGITRFDVDLSAYEYYDLSDKIQPWPMFTNTSMMSIYSKSKLKSKFLKRPSAKYALEDYNYVGFVLQGADDNPHVNCTPKSKSKAAEEIKAPGFLLFDTLLSAEQYCEFMKTKTYKCLISCTKCISKTQPQFICQIGDFDFGSLSITDDNLFTFFGLDADEQKYIMQNY